MPQPSCGQELIHKTCSWTSCSLSDNLPKTSEAAPPTQRSQLLLRNRVFIVGYNMEGQCLSAGLPYRCSLHTWCTSCRPSRLSSSLLPSLFSYTLGASRRNISLQRITAMPCDTLYIYSYLWAKCKSLVHFSSVSLGKKCLVEFGQPHRSRVKSGKKGLMLRWITLTFKTKMWKTANCSEAQYNMVRIEF